MGKDAMFLERREIQITRGPYSEEYLLENNCSTSEKLAGPKQFTRAVYEKLVSYSWSLSCCRGFLFRLFPILDWLPKYNVKKDILGDVSGGVTVGIMHIPQGLAFAMLASLPPVTGLYTALVPVLMYMLMGTSKHLSVGSFAVISLMVAQVCEREAASMLGPTPAPVNSSNASLASPPNSGPWSESDTVKMEVAVTLSFVIGIIQVAMGAVRLGVIATFLSDPMISGFTTGSAVLVVITQVKHILGLEIPKITGPFSSPKVVIYMLKNIPSSNVGAIITGVTCILVLIGLKRLNEKYKDKMKVPVPAELLVVIVGTAISFGASINQKFDVSIIGEIPKGLPPLSVPSMPLIARVIPDAFVIAVVIFATNISLTKMFAKKFGYQIDPNQELIAYGAGNIAGAFFSCFAICNALARSVVQANLANTQLCGVVVMALILLVLLFLARLFFYLPKAILAAVVIANLIGLLRQFSRLKDLWKIHRPDAVVWFVTCAGVLLLGIDKGLYIGVICALLAVVVTLSRSEYSELGWLKDTELYRDIKECPTVVELPGVKIIRFESSVYFGNAERFRNVLVAVTNLDPSTTPKRKELKLPDDTSEHVGLLEEENEPNHNYISTDSTKLQNGSIHDHVHFEIEETVEIHTIVIDCSSFNFIDSVGLHVLPSLIDEFGKVGVKILLAGCSSMIRKKLQRQCGGLVNKIPYDMMFPSIHDAVMSTTPSRDLAICFGVVERETVL